MTPIDPELRDMIVETHSDMKWVKQNFVDHKVDDITRFAEIDKKIGWGIKLAVAVLVIVAANGGMQAIRLLFSVSK